MSGVERALNEAGFDSLEEYLRSALWRIVETEVLTRDQQDCRVCSATAERVLHLALNAPTFLGVSPYALASVCDDCYESCWIDGVNRRVSPYRASGKAFYMVTGIPKIPGRSDNRIGYWHTTQRKDPTNAKIRDRIIRRVKRELPRIYQAHSAIYTRR